MSWTKTLSFLLQDSTVSFESIILLGLVRSSVESIMPSKRALFDLVEKTTKKNQASKIDRVQALIAADPDSVHRRFWHCSFPYAPEENDEDIYNNYDIEGAPTGEEGFVSPVHEAASNGLDKILTLLLENGGDKDDYWHMDGFGVSAVDAAITNGSIECVKIFRSYGVTIYGLEMGIDVAFDTKDVAMLEYLKSIGITPDR